MAAMEAEIWGRFEDHPVRRATIESPSGMRARVLDWGATLQSVRTSDGAELCLGFARFDDYPALSPFFGSTVGRFANRIAGGRFELAGAVHELPKNENGETCLHGGGSLSWGKRMWRLLEPECGPRRVALAFASPDGDAGFPGAVRAKTVYQWTDQDALRIEMTAESDAETVVNMAHHSYWTLSGFGSGIAEDRLAIEADRRLVVDARNIPTGETRATTGTEFDFREPRPIGEAEIDHCFEIRGAGFRKVATLEGSRAAMELWADQPGVQLYTGFKLDFAANDGTRFFPRMGVCLETQGYPDAPNRPEFPSTVLRPGETYRHVMEHRFR